MATFNKKQSPTNTLGRELLHEEYFEVDRTKLQKMSSTVTFIDAKTKADLYFEQIMESTQTRVEWKQPLDQAIKNKHHPFIRVSGRRKDDITWAKGLILSRLEINDSIYRLKMAVSNVEHHFIMGRNNNIVNRIMNDTQTHIQFPDPNMIKKGNQITVHGMLDDLEEARSLLRLSSPVVLSFELPANRQVPSPESVGNNYKVHVMFLSSPKPNTMLVLIRASTRRVDNLKQATRSLLCYALGKMAINSIVSVQVQVPPQHHDAVKGENCENLTQIMEHTNTKIFFPDLSMRGNRRSQVTITGTVDEVLAARNELVGNFPIELTFDISDEYETATDIMELGRKAGVRITISHKEKDIGMSVTIKGSEKSIERIYEIHRIIRQLNSVNKAHMFDLFEGAYQRQIDALIDNDDSGNSEERSETISEGEFNQQSPITSSPINAAQDDVQQNIWTIYDPNQSPNTQQISYQQSFDTSVPQVQYYSPLQNYQDCQAWNNWMQAHAVEDNLSTNGRDVPITPEDHYNYNGINYEQEMQIQPNYSTPLHQQQNDWTFAEFHQGNHQQQLVQIHPDYLQQTQEQAEADVITFGNFDSQQMKLLTLQNSNDDFENKQSSTQVFESEENVAARLICNGWGSLF